MGIPYIRTIKLMGILCVSVLLCACRGSANPLPSEGSIEINFPLNKRCIYASSFIVQSADSLYLNGLHIFSLEFIHKTDTTDAINYTGWVTSYVPPNLANLKSLQISSPVSGHVWVMIKNNWVLFQFSEVYEAFNMFIKTGTDTTDLPQQYKNQFPSFPHHISPFSQYSAFRPENSGLEWGYTDVYREFHAGDFRNWGTTYTQYHGIFMSGRHELLNMSIDMSMIIDEKGIIISQLSFGHAVIMNDQGSPIDTVHTFIINERLVDFTNPDMLKPLSYYADEILSGDITLPDFF